MRQIDRRDLDARATEAGVKIVQVCGFEALPPDLAVQLLVDAARERWDDELAEADVAISFTGQPPGLPRPSDMISGGTFQSMAEAAARPTRRCSPTRGADLRPRAWPQRSALAARSGCARAAAPTAR